MYAAYVFSVRLVLMQGLVGLSYKHTLSALPRNILQKYMSDEMHIETLARSLRSTNLCRKLACVNAYTNTFAFL